MRPPRPRFTVRRLMVAVAIVGGVLGLLSWSRTRVVNFRRLADHHGRLSRELQQTREGYTCTFGTPRSDYHRVMEAKYLRAAEHPWSPVAPDPPEPK
jgi:hypothetical protein